MDITRWWQQTYLQVRAYPYYRDTPPAPELPDLDYLEIRVEVDCCIVATGTGRTLGEAFMDAGAKMLGLASLPVSDELLDRLKAPDAAS